MIELHDGRITEWGELKAHYNFTKKHCSLKDRTPAEQALIAVDGKNKRITLIQDASLYTRKIQSKPALDNLTEQYRGIVVAAFCTPFLSCFKTVLILLLVSYCRTVPYDQTQSDLAASLETLVIADICFSAFLHVNGISPIFDALCKDSE